MTKEAWNQKGGTGTNRPTCLICLAYLTCLTASAPASDVPPSPALVAAHLNQAESLKPNAAANYDEALKALTKKIAAKLDAREKELSQESARPALLAGIPADVLAQARTLAGDESRLREFLKKGAPFPLLLALTAERNPEACSAREAWRAQLRRFDQAAYLEQLVSQYRSFVRELDTTVGPQSHKEMPEATFPFPAALTLKGQIVDAEAELARLRYEAVLRAKLNEMLRAVANLRYLIAAEALVNESRALLEQTVQSIEGRVKSGLANQSELLGLQSDLAMLDARRVTLQREAVTARARASALLNLPPDCEWGVPAAAGAPGALPSLDASLRLAAARSQDLKMAQREAGLMELMVRMAETELLPRGSAGHSRLAPSTGAEAGPTRSEMAAFPDRPDVNAARAAFGVNAAYLDELRVRVVQAQREQDAAAARVKLEVQEALFACQAAELELKALDEAVLPKAKQNFENVRQRYTAGAVSLDAYVAAGREFLEAQLKREAALRERAGAWAGWQDAVGVGVAGELSHDGSK